MTTLKKLLLAAALAFSALGAFAQTPLVQTTTSADQQCGAACAMSGVGSGTTYQTTLALTSATGITQAFNGQPVTFVYVDQELEGVLSLVTGQTLIFNVLRAQNGTKASAHKSGSMALIQVVTPQFGGFSGSGGFQLTDPPVTSQCTAAQTLVTPWVNINNGAQWLCSTVTGTWVPGFNNPYPFRPTAAVASAAGLITPSGPLFHITGALAITGFNIPVGFNGGEICVIPDGAFTTTTANNIALASTGVVSKQLCWLFDSATAKFYPAY